MFPRAGHSICCANTHSVNHDKQWLRSRAIVFYLAARKKRSSLRKTGIIPHSHRGNIEQAPNKTSSAGCFDIYWRISLSETYRF